MQTEYEREYATATRRPQTITDLILRHAQELDETGKDLRRQLNQKTNGADWRIELAQKQLELARIR